MQIRNWVRFSFIFVILAIALPLSANQTDLPFVLYRGYTIVVRGSIGNRKGLNFIIDTGAVPSVVDNRLSHRLGLVGRADHVSVFARTVLTQRVVLPEVNLGQVHVAGAEALVEDLSFIERALGVRIDALIGLNVLGKMNFSIDFESNCLRFDSLLDPTDVWADMAEDDVDCAVLKIELNGVPVRLMVDTGVNHLILFESRTERLFAKDRIQTEKVSSTIGGRVRLRQSEPPSARLGKTPLTVTSVLVLATPAKLSLSIDGLLGVAELNPVRVDFDFVRRAIGWKW